MRVQRSKRLENIWYRADNDLRTFVNHLGVDPRPVGVLESKVRPGTREEFVGGYWVIWEVDESGSETIIRVTISD